VDSDFQKPVVALFHQWFALDEKCICTLHKSIKEINSKLISILKYMVFKKKNKKKEDLPAKKFPKASYQRVPQLQSAHSLHLLCPDCSWQ